MVERMRGVADYISEKTGVFVSEWSVKRLAHRPLDPLPLLRFGTRVAAREEDLDAWIGRQWKPAYSRSRAR